MSEGVYTAAELKKMWERTQVEQIGIMQAKMIEAIKETDGKISASWSGGKDSSFMVYMLCMTWKMLGRTDPIMLTFADTTNEHKTMYKFVEEYPKWLEEQFGVKLNIIKTRPDNNDTFATVALREGIPLISKKTSMKIRRVRKYMEQCNLTYSDIEPYLEGNYECRDKLRELGLNDDAILILIGYSCKHDNFNSSFKLAQRWRPFINFRDYPEAKDIILTEECCTILKKKPIAKANAGIGGYQPMIGEMAQDSQTRKESYLKTGCNHFIDGKGKSKPMGPMTEQAVLYGIDKYKIPMPEVYGTLECIDGEYKFSKQQRSGCCLCGFGILYEPDRFINLAKDEPAKVKFAFKHRKEGGLGYREAIEFMNKHCGCNIGIPEFEEGAK